MACAYYSMRVTHLKPATERFDSFHQPFPKLELVRFSIRWQGGNMGIFSWIIFGLIAGLLAKAIMPGKDPGGWIVTILLGIAGAVVGGFVATLLGFGNVSGFNLYSFLIAILGSLILLWLYRMFKRTA